MSSALLQDRGFMRPFLLKTSPILTVTYTGCNTEMRSNMYRGAQGPVIGATVLVSVVLAEWFNYVS